MKRLTQVLLAELRREARHQLSYRLEYASGVLLYTLGFLLLTGIFDLLAEGSFNEQGYEMALVGFVTWRLADRCVVRANRILADDAQWGTLEQVWLSGISPAWLFGSRVVAVLLVQLPAVALIATAAGLVLGLHPAISPALLPVLGLTLLGAMGLSFLLSGLQLVYKQVDFVAFALSSALLFTTGAWAPLDNVPQLYALTRFLPLASGITLMQQMVSRDLPLAGVLASPDWLYLLANTIGYLGLGLTALAWGRRTAERRGTLAHY